MNMNRVVSQNGQENMDSKPALPKEKVMSYEAKSVGSTAFFKCEACPYMAFAEDDIKFHLFTVHPELAKRNGLADNIQIPCPGCTSVFDAEETLRTHLRNHHKMGIKDVKKMVKSLVQIALKHAKLIKEITVNEPNPPQQQLTEVKIPQVIEIVPDIVNGNNKQLPKGVAFISVDELNKMSMPNFEKVDPKEVIQEASINIVYTNDVSTQYINVSNTSTSNTTCNLIQMSSVTPDLISSIQPRMPAVDKNLSSPQIKESQEDTHIPMKPERGRLTPYPNRKEPRNSNDKQEKEYVCLVGNCHAHFKEELNLSYHRRCHKDGDITCAECSEIFTTVEQLHIHLWKIHKIDLELPTCEVCGYKTFLRYRLRVHMKSHGTFKAYACTVCQKKFKSSNQLSKHMLYHRRNGPPVQCEVCQKGFTNVRLLSRHVATVHDKLKPFKCCECEYTAARKEELKLHMRSHTGDKPYACDQCEYRSGDHNALRRHKKKHSNDSAYKCKYCPYTAIQSTRYTAHMLSKHPDLNSDGVHCCPYCAFKSVNKDKYSVHLTTHRDKEGIKLLLEMTKLKTTKPSWTIPSEDSDKQEEIPNKSNEQSTEGSPKTVNTIPIEVFDCDSLPDIMPQEYPKNYCKTSSENNQQTNFNPEIVTDLSKDDNNSDCLISADFNIQERHQYSSQHPLQMTYDSSQTNLHFLPSVSLDQNLLQSNNVNSLASTHSPVNNTIGNNIMCNFPIRLPPASIALRNNITLNPVSKISLPMTKVIGPIIKPMQILPVPSSRHSPINISNEIDGVPRKKPKISVKSNLILKGPDQVNMFHSQQKMAFKQLEDNERYGLGGAVTFNNLITTQFMQLPPEPALSESPNTIMAYPQDSMLEDSASTPVDNGINENPQIFSFNQQMNVRSMTMLPPQQKIQTTDPSYIKLETQIKQNTQSPSLERMCNANLLSNQSISREYKASPPLEDIHKNMNEIKNEVKSDAFYTMALNNTAANPPLIDQYMIDNIIPEQYPAHLDLSSVVLPEVSDQQSDVIEIDDNSDDNKLLPRFDMNFSLESLCLMHNDFHFLENDIPSNNLPTELPVNEMNRMVPEVPIINPKDNLDVVPVESNDCQNYIQGKKDPMMNTSVRPSTNKINVKNIELMKN
ncbi:jg18933 [Pararge aegeria aegeria]|uniref:Jg18933 protein n=8 Tax=Pararge aegeria TaxID=116150 RepID=A0A8S4SR34_9NEOP|nr:jg18933 [Pararge aegeria aegeria]